MDFDEKGKGNKGFAFVISLYALCGRHSGGALRPFPSREGPRPDGINHSSGMNPDFTVQRTGLTHGAFQRGPSTCSRNMERTRARMTRRADVKRKIKCSIAHMKYAEKIYTARTFWLNRSGYAFLYSGWDTNKVSPFYMRVSIAVCAAIAEQTEKSSEELFSHVSAGRTRFARKPLG